MSFPAVNEIVASAQAGVQAKSITSWLPAYAGIRSEAALA